MKYVLDTATGWRIEIVQTNMKDIYEVIVFRLEKVLTTDERISAQDQKEITVKGLTIAMKMIQRSIFQEIENLQETTTNIVSQLDSLTFWDRYEVKDE